MASIRCANAPSSARFFVQLAKRTSSSPAPILDVFAPRLISRTGGRAAYSTALRPRTRNVNELRGCTMASTARAPATPSQVRTFVSTAPRNATACVHNPQKDDDGADMFLDITDRAGKRLAQIMQKDNNPNLALRIQVESGGCHGFQYLMSLVTLPSSDLSPGSGGDSASTVAGTALGEDDSVFQYAAEGAAAADTPTSGAPKIVIDQPSLELLKGSKVDFTMELIGSQFKITDNPYATSACGCGTSFDIKI